MTVLGEIETLLLLEGRFQIGCLPDQARLAFLADSAFEHRLDKDQLVAIDETLDLVLSRAGPQNFRRGEVDVLEKLRAVQHSCDLHLTSPSFRRPSGGL